LHHSPDNGQTAHLRREGINLIGALSHIAEKAFDGIGRLDMTSHCRWLVIKGQKMFFILNQATYRFRIALTIFRFERIQLRVICLIL